MRLWYPNCCKSSQQQDSTKKLFTAIASDQQQVAHKHGTHLLNLPTFLYYNIQGMWSLKNNLLISLCFNYFSFLPKYLLSQLFLIKAEIFVAFWFFKLYSIIIILSSPKSALNLVLNLVWRWNNLKWCKCYIKQNKMYKWFHVTITQI